MQPTRMEESMFETPFNTSVASRHREPHRSGTEEASALLLIEKNKKKVDLEHHSHSNGTFFSRDERRGAKKGDRRPEVRQLRSVVVLHFMLLFTSLLARVVLSEGLGECIGNCHSIMRRAKQVGVDANPPTRTASTSLVALSLHVGSFRHFRYLFGPQNHAPPTANFSVKASENCLQISFHFSCSLFFASRLLYCHNFPSFRISCQKKKPKTFSIA